MNRFPVDIVYWIRGEEHTELAKLSIASVHKVYSMARVYVYTDDPDNTPHIEGTLRCVMPKGYAPMVANVHAQMTHVLSAQTGTNVLFLDTDTLLQDAIPINGDLAVTWRSPDTNGVSGAMPYNYGVMACSVISPVREAFAWMKSRVLSMSEGHQNWYGNQLALADLVGGVTQDAIKHIRIKWSSGDPGTPLSVGLLPCDVFNYTPNGEGEDVSGKVVLHM